MGCKAVWKKFPWVFRGPLSNGNNMYFKVQKLVFSSMPAEILEKRFQATMGLKAFWRTKL